MKLAIYAICKNEEGFLPWWILKVLTTDADYICVMDTGSTDNTYTILKDWERMYPDRIKVDQKIIDPWRFDVARNESLKLIPNDVDWWLCLDLDEEIVEPNLKPLIEAQLAKYQGRNISTINYLYNWGDNRIFYYDKLHRKEDGGKWVGAVHEGYVVPHPDPTHGIIEKVLVVHHADRSKPRNYLPLLEIRAKENPDDMMGWLYLMLEYTYRGMWQKAMDVIQEHLLDYAQTNMFDETSTYIIFYAGLCCRRLDRKMSALHYFIIAATQGCLEAALERMEIYLELGDILKARREISRFMEMLDDGRCSNNFWMELVNAASYRFRERLNTVFKKVTKIR